MIIPSRQSTTVFVAHIRVSGELFRDATWPIGRQEELGSEEKKHGKEEWLMGVSIFVLRHAQDARYRRAHHNCIISL